VRHALLLACAILIFGCAPQPDFRPAALAFAQALAAKDYPRAHGMMTAATRRTVTPESLRTQFERMIPKDFGPIGAVELGRTMTSWPDKQAADLGWAYVGIGGNTYSEAVIVIVALENGAPMVRQAEFGRP
jgi:hypothetical protein